MNVQQSLAYSLIALLLRVALVASLCGAAWNIYRRLPGGEPAVVNDTDSATALQIVLRPAPDEAGIAMNIPVELYPIDLAAARREFFDERRPGKRFEDFLVERMRGRPPVEARLDERGQAAVMIRPGKWWVHATLGGAQNTEWRLPVNVAGRKQTVELTPDNAYARTKSF